MDVKELRVGNIVKWKGKSYVTLELCDFAELHRNKQYFDVASGEPLTEEWLLNFHKNIIDLSNSIFRIGRFKYIYKFAYKYWYIVDDIENTYITKIEFVHEHQNFWKFINGEELTTK